MALYSLDLASALGSTLGSWMEGSGTRALAGLAFSVPGTLLTVSGSSGWPRDHWREERRVRGTGDGHTEAQKSISGMQLLRAPVHEEPPS